MPFDDRRRADLAVAPDADVRADQRERTDGGALADHRGGRHARGRIDVRDRTDGEQQVGFDHGLAVDFGKRRGLHQRPARGAERHDQLQLVAGDDVLAELGAVDAAQLDAGVVAPVHFIEQQQRRRLRQRLDHEDRRHQRLVRKMSLEEIFVDGDVLEGDQPLSRLVLGDGVDEERGKAVGEAIERVRRRARRYGGQVCGPGVH